MSHPALYLPSTRLRRSYEHARSMDGASQIQECADHLSNPELIVAEMDDASRAIETFDESELGELCNRSSYDANEDSAELVLEHFYESQQVEIVGEDSSSFRCLATNVVPMPELMPSQSGAKEGFDYVALRPGPEQNPILGVTQSCDDVSAYPLLLRLLCCLSEIGTPRRLEQLALDRFKGALPADPTFDLHMVLWSEDDGLSEPESALCELTRDLAEVTRVGMSSTPALARLVGGIRCLRMDPRKFDNRLWQVWQI